MGRSEPWANPEAPWKILQWIWRDDAPLPFRLRMDPRQWPWGLCFLYECLPSRTHQNIAQLVKLSLYSRKSLQELRASTGIEYDHLTQGILHYYTDAAEFERAMDSATIMRKYGLDRDVKTVAEALAIEPALASARDRIVRATYTGTDGSGDGHLFTVRLARMAQDKGTRFRFGRSVIAIRAEGGRLTGVAVRNAQGREEILKADAYVVALGSYSPLMTRPSASTFPCIPRRATRPPCRSATNRRHRT